jgi:hypothetical protein
MATEKKPAAKKVAAKKPVEATKTTTVKKSAKKPRDLAPKSDKPAAERRKDAAARVIKEGVGNKLVDLAAELKAVTMPAAQAFEPAPVVVIAEPLPWEPSPEVTNVEPVALAPVITQEPDVPKVNSTYGSFSNDRAGEFFGETRKPVRVTGERLPSAGGKISMSAALSGHRSTEPQTPAPGGKLRLSSLFRN